MQEIKQPVWAQLIKKTFSVTKKYASSMLPGAEIKRENTKRCIAFTDLLCSNEVSVESIDEMFKTFLDNPENLKLVKMGVVIQSGNKREAGKLFETGVNKKEKHIGKTKKNKNDPVEGEEDEGPEFIFKYKAIDGVTNETAVLNIRSYMKYIYRLFVLRIKEDEKKGKDAVLKTEQMFESNVDYIYCSIGLAIKEYAVKKAYPTAEDAAAIALGNSFTMPKEPENESFADKVGNLFEIVEKNHFGKMILPYLPSGSLRAIHKGLEFISPSNLSSLPARAQRAFTNNDLEESTIITNQLGTFFEAAISELGTTEDIPAYDQRI